MKLDVHTLAIVLCLSGFLQTVVLYIQYRLNSEQRGLGWWVLGSLAFSCGFAANYLRDAQLIGHLAIVGNNILFASGLLLLYIGVMQFFYHKVKFSRILILFTVILTYYALFTFVCDNFIVRRVFLSVVIASISLMISAFLFVRRKSSVNASIYFLVSVFTVYGFYYILRAILLLAGEQNENIFSPTFTQTSFFFASIIASNLWTFGLIMLINQRLNAQHIEEKEHFELIFNTSPDAVIITRYSDGLIVDVNDSFTAMTGHERSEVIGRSTLDVGLWHTIEDRRMIMELIAEIGFIENVEMLFRRKDGSLITGVFHARIFNSRGVPHVMSVTRDITARKRAEDALRETEARYRRIVDTANEGIMYLDRDFKLTFANTQMASMLSYSVEEMIGKNYSSFLAEDQLEDNAEQMKIRAEGKDSIYERCFITKEGKRHWLLVSAKAVISSDGVFAGSFAMFTDINERKLMEEAILLHNRRLQLLLELTQTKETELQVILDKALEYALQLTSSTLGYIYHYSEADRQFVLNTWSKDAMKECKIVNPQTVYQLDRTGIWGEAVRQRKPIMVNDFQAENQLKKGYPEGHVHLRRFLTVPVFSDDLIVGVIGVGNKVEPYDGIDILQLNLLAESVWSISRQKEDEGKIREYAEKLKDLNATKDRFFSIIAHDLRGPFNGILMLSRLLMDKAGKYDGDTVDYIRLIYNSSKSAFNLLENLLEWSMLQMGRVEFKPEYISFDEVLGNSLEVLRSQAKNKDIKIESSSEVESIYDDLVKSLF